MADRKIQIEVKHSFDFGKSSGAQVNKDFKAQMRAMSQVGESIRKTASTNATLADTLKTTNKVLDSVAKESGENQKTAYGKMLSNALSNYEKLDKSALGGGRGDTIRSLYSQLNDFDKNIGSLNNSTKQKIREFSSAISIAKASQGSNKSSAWYQDSSSLAYTLGGALAYASLQSLNNVGGISSAYNATLPTTSIQDLGQMGVNYQNQIRSSISQGIQTGLVGSGAAIGFAIGNVPGSIIGGLIAEGLSIPANIWAQGKNAATQQAYLTNLASLQAHFGFGNLNENLSQVGVGGSLLNDAIPTNVTGRINNLISSGKGYEIGPLLSSGGSFRRFGQNLSPEILNQLSAYGALYPNMDISSLANPLAFINAKSGMNMLPQIGFLANQTGTDPATIAQRIQSLMGGSALSTFSAASNFLGNTMSAGDQFQAAAAGFESSGPTNQFARSFMLRNLLGVDANKLFNGTPQERSAEIAKVKSFESSLNQAGFPAGDMMAEQVLGGAQNYYAVNNANKTSTGNYQEGALSSKQFAQMIADAIQQMGKSMQANVVNITANQVNQHGSESSSSGTLSVRQLTSKFFSSPF